MAEQTGARERTSEMESGQNRGAGTPQTYNPIQYSVRTFVGGKRTRWAVAIANAARILMPIILYGLLRSYQIMSHISYDQCSHFVRKKASMQTHTPTQTQIIKTKIVRPVSELVYAHGNQHCVFDQLSLCKHSVSAQFQLVCDCRDPGPSIFGMAHGSASTGIAHECIWCDNKV